VTRRKKAGTRNQGNVLQLGFLKGKRSVAVASEKEFNEDETRSLGDHQEENEAFRI